MEGSSSSTLLRWALTLMVLLAVIAVNQAQSSSLMRQSSATPATQNSLRQFGQALPAASGEYLLIGPDNGLSPFSNLGQQLLYSQNANKRASRRVSSFMPMRGRKDGRDSAGSRRPQLYSLADGPEEETELFYLPAAGDSQDELASGLMQAKLRRAFHPMRGKKSDSSAAEMVDDPVDALDS